MVPVNRLAAAVPGGSIVVVMGDSRRRTLFRVQSCTNEYGVSDMVPVNRLAAAVPGGSIVVVMGDSRRSSIVVGLGHAFLLQLNMGMLWSDK
jgi:archaellum biogenesis ATPase FlaH